MAIGPSALDAAQGFETGTALATGVVAQFIEVETAARDEVVAVFGKRRGKGIEVAAIVEPRAVDEGFIFRFGGLFEGVRRPALRRAETSMSSAIASSAGKREKSDSGRKNSRVRQAWWANARAAKITTPARM